MPAPSSPPAPAAAPPVPPRFSAGVRGLLRDVARYRAFVWRNAVADVRTRYAGTSAGVWWNLIQPLALLVIFGTVFSEIMAARMPPAHGGASFPYVLYLCSGLFPWFAFAEGVTRGCNAFRENASYLKKLPIPAPVFVAQATATSAITLTVSFALVVLAALLAGVHPAWSWLLLPLPLLSLLVTAFGVGLLCGTLNVFFRDVGQALPIVLQLAMWTAPIVYLPEVVPALFRHLAVLHPLTPVFTGLRAMLLYGAVPGPLTFAGLLLWPAALASSALFVFAKARDEIRDVL